MHFQYRAGHVPVYLDQLHLSEAAYAHGGIEIVVAFLVGALFAAIAAGTLKWFALRRFWSGRPRSRLLIPVGLLEIVLFWGALFIAAQSGIASFVDLILLATVLFLPLAMFPNRLLLPEGPGRTVKALLLSAPFPVLLGIGGGLVFGGSG